ncbi:MAG: ATP-dependent helicase HrpB [Chlorobi bacterium CHB2]|nr:ATP-dependent helicase HrpB [Chlorobi bacterium CHB2]
MPSLPIEPVLPELCAALSQHPNVVLQAPPGAGKTTCVPLALLGQEWLRDKKIAMLEPRRIAARAAARRMAGLLGQQVGQTVGYRTRMDTAIGPTTRIEVLTEGVLARMLQSDPALEQFGVVIFDEFHERSIHADLGLALALQSQHLLRADLRLLVMSATLDGQPVSQLLGNAPIITSHGRSFPVETIYLEKRTEERLERTVAAAVSRALRQCEGDLLVFLPGVAEIQRVEETLRGSNLPGNIAIAPLHGSLPQDQQDRAIQPSPHGQRKVVLSTSIAETSLTIEGVRAVVDSGLMRVPRFSPRNGMSRLETITVTRAAADQRRGRAGRLGPGHCFRLWTLADDATLLPHTTPEILEADLLPLALELAEWGVRHPEELQWLDSPPPAAFAQSRGLLAQLGAIAPNGEITQHGKKMARLPLHPRLAQMVLKAKERGWGGTACLLAALLSERDVMQGDRSADVRLRLEAVQRGANGGERGATGRIGTIRTAARTLRRSLGISDQEAVGVDACGPLLSIAFPDRIGARRAGTEGRFLLRNGNAARLDPNDPLARADFLVATELDGRRSESRIFLAAPLLLADIEDQFGEQIQEEEVVEWDAGTESVRAMRRTRLGGITLREQPLANPSPQHLALALAGAIAAEELRPLPWSRQSRQLQQRLAFLRQFDPALPDCSDATLQRTVGEWLAPNLHGFKRLSEVGKLDMEKVLLGMIPWDIQRQLELDAPTHLSVPSGSRIPIDYSNPADPVLAVRLQEMFGCAETPRIARGRVPLTVHLLSPANRPVQVTRDLAGFWHSSYFDVRRDLRGRYPKHHWPENPMEAEPTRRAKRKGE